MGNLTYQKAFRRQQKKSYKGLTDKQKKYIKAKQLSEQMDKALNYFYSHCKRKSNGAVDFSTMSECELDAFDYWNKEKEKAIKILSTLEDEIDVNNTLDIFLQMNTHSMSF